MSCIRELSITITEEPEEAEDMPLHSAVYHPTLGKIFAVRGGRVFQFNETTLAKENEVQYNFGPTLSDSYIAYDSGRDCLWVTYSPDFVAPPDFVQPTNDKYIYKLDPSNLSILQTIGFDANTLGPAAQAYRCNDVIRHITVNGVQLACWINALGNSNGARFIVFDPDNLPFPIFNRAFSAARWAFLQVKPSSTNYFFCTDDHSNSGPQEYTNANVFVADGGWYPIQGDDTTKRVYGFAYVADNGFHYCANRSNLILRLDASNNVLGTAIDTGGADIWNIRLNPNDGLLYAADFGGNQIFVIDPSDDSFDVKGGFDAPWDICFTSSKAIAIQHSSEGLKEII